MFECVVRSSVCPASYHQPIWKHEFTHHPLICGTPLPLLSPIPIHCLASFVRFIAFQGDFAYLVMIPNSKYLNNGIVFRWKSRPAMRNPWYGKCLPTRILRHKVHWQILDSSKEWSLPIFVFLPFLECWSKRVIINSIRRHTLWKVVNWKIGNNQYH